MPQRPYRIGVQSCILRLFPLELALQKISGAGYDGIELWGGQFHGYAPDFARLSGDEWIIDEGRIEQARELCNRSKLSLVCYTPEQCIYPINYLMEDVDPFDGPRLAAQSRKLLHMSIDISSALGCNRVVLCSPLWHWHKRAGEYERVTKEQAVKAAIQALESFVRHAEDRHVAILFEPLVYHDSNAIETLDDVTSMIEQIPSPNLQLLIDTGHIQVTAKRCGEDPVSYLRSHFERFADRIRHIHLDDNDGVTDSHLLPGEGEVDFQAMLRVLRDFGYADWLSLEVTGLGPYPLPEKAESVLKQGIAYIDSLIKVP